VRDGNNRAQGRDFDKRTLVNFRDRQKPALSLHS